MATTEQIDSMMLKVAEIQAAKVDLRAKRVVSDAAFAANNRSMAKWMARIDSGDDPTTASMRALAELRLADEEAYATAAHDAGGADTTLSSKQNDLDNIVAAILYP